MCALLKLATLKRCGRSDITLCSVELGYAGRQENEKMCSDKVTMEKQIWQKKLSLHWSIGGRLGVAVAGTP